MGVKLESREAWLAQAAESLWSLLDKFGTIPDVTHVICSWPTKRIRRVIGECYFPEWTEDRSVYITISPMLDDPKMILRTLIHEMVHAIGFKGHGKKFQTVCERIGLLNESAEGKATGDEKFSPELDARLTELITVLGDYPHTPLIPPVKKKKKSDGEKKRPWTVCVDPEDDEYWVQVRTSILEKYGPPLCPNGERAMVILKEEEDDQAAAVSSPESA